MKLIITWHEFTSKHPRDQRFNCDEYSKQICKVFVEKHCDCKCTYFSTPIEDSCIDFLMYALKTNTRFGCEIKDRWNYTSKTFKDHVIETSKLNGLIYKVNTKEIDKVSLFTLYDDGVLKVTADLLNNLIGYQDTLAPTTTALENHDIINKEFVLIKPQTTKYFCIYEETDETNNVVKWTPLFSDNQINIKSLNEQLQRQEFMQLF